MLILQSIHELKNFRSSLSKNEELGLIPTMGALHNGHLSLITEAKQKSQKIIVSIFVNPLQFNNTQDFTKYPVKTHEDLALLEAAGCDAVFMPHAKDIYTETPVLSFDFGTLTNSMEGLFRPGHFNGVAIIVSKLLNIIKPHNAFFGEKDLQQLRVIECLVRDLSMDVNIVPCKTIREKNGLAMSSRNMRLSLEQKERATSIYAYLTKAQRLLGTLSHSEIETLLTKEIEQEGLIRLEYLTIVDKNLLSPCANLFQNQDVAICIAAFVDEIRLIDNIVVSS